MREHRDPPGSLLTAYRLNRPSRFPVRSTPQQSWWGPWVEFRIRSAIDRIRPVRVFLPCGRSRKPDSCKHGRAFEQIRLSANTAESVRILSAPPTGRSRRSQRLASSTCDPEAFQRGECSSPACGGGPERHFAVGIEEAPRLHASEPVRSSLTMQRQKVIVPAWVDAYFRGQISGPS